MQQLLMQNHQNTVSKQATRAYLHIQQQTCWEIVQVRYTELNKLALIINLASQFPIALVHSSLFVIYNPSQLTHVN